MQQLSQELGGLSVGGGACVQLLACCVCACRRSPLLHVRPSHALGALLTPMTCWKETADGVL